MPPSWRGVRGRCYAITTIWPALASTKLQLKCSVQVQWLPDPAALVAVLSDNLVPTDHIFQTDFFGFSKFVF
jgi:hypothetical protein